MLPARTEKILKVLLGSLGVLFVLLFASGVYLYRLSASLPDIAIDPNSIPAARTSIVYAADGTVLAEWHAEQDRRLVSLDDLPKSVGDAVVAIEDERFYEHNGVDVRAVARALAINGRAGAYRQGGSTITQQVVKLLFTDGKRTLGRKVREALMAYQLETKADKHQVLGTYLNLVYFGSGAYGVESAAEHYFGKHASELTIAESAMLAGVIRSPARYSPRANPGAALERRNAVIRKMRDLGYITAHQEAQSLAAPVDLVPPKASSEIAPYFVEYVKQELIKKLGADAVFRGGLRVYTTLVPRLQKRAEAAVEQRLPWKKDPGAAVVSMDYRTGDIVALVGGRDFSADQFNLAVQGKRQPGSAFKPFVLVTALQQGITPDRTFGAGPYEVQVKDGIWRVDNYENDKTSHSLTLRAATIWSVNAVYARLIMQVGADNVAATAKRMGITTHVDPNPAIALGGLSRGVSPLEMADAYSTLASGGLRVTPRSVVRVTDDAGHAVLGYPTTRKRVLPAATAATASSLLHDVVQRGTGVEAAYGPWAAGKTGTTQSYRDAWFVGWSSGLTTAVWVGYPQGQVSMTRVHGIKVTGGSFPARIWHDYMAAGSHGSVADASDTGSGGRTTLVRICQETFLLANDRCPNVQELYLDSRQVPTRVCTKH